MPVTGNDLTGLEGGPEVICDGLIRKIVADCFLHLLEPSENFLVGPELISKRNFRRV